MCTASCRRIILIRSRAGSGGEPVPHNLIVAISLIPPWAYIAAGVCLFWAIVTRIARGGG